MAVQREGQWCEGAKPKRITVTSAGQIIVIAQGPCYLVGAILRAGASEAILRLYDQKEGPAVAENEIPGVRTATYDGYVNMPSTCDNGVIATLDQTDAIAWIWYVPL